MSEKSLGSPESPKWAFNTLTRLDPTNGGALTAEQMDYLYDAQGRLEGAAFAQTPYSGFTPATGNPWYDSTHHAGSRARAFYTYDPAGRVSEVDHWWDTWNYSTSAWNASTYVVGSSCAYGLSGNNRGLKTSDTYLNNNPGGYGTTAVPGAWVSDGYELAGELRTSVTDPRVPAKI
ncbi:MAG: hypothetical protein ACYC96_02335 [Fimbriimonadaceae bacterium]